MRHSASVPTSREWLVIYLCTLAALAVMWNRNALPQWMRPELRPRTRSIAFIPGPVTLPGFDWRDFEPERLVLHGATTLVVGDSMVYHWPTGTFDLMSWPGLTVPAVADHFAGAIGSRHYRRILIWAGTCDLSSGFTNRDDLVAAYDCMMQLGREHADDVHLIQPYGLARDTGWVPYTIWTGWMYRGPREWYRVDGFHPSTMGFENLISTLPPLVQREQNPPISTAVDMGA